MTGLFTVENVGAGAGFKPYLKTSETVGFGTSESNGASFNLRFKGEELGHKMVPRDQIENKPIPVALTVTSSKATVKVGEIELAGKIEAEAAGQVELLGGLGGVKIKSLVISGVPEVEWAKEFFKQ